MVAERVLLARPITARRNNITVRVPYPLRNTVQGGAHAVLKAKVGDKVFKSSMSDLAIQERHIIPNFADMGQNQRAANMIQNIAMNLIANAEGMKLSGTCNEGGIGAFFRQHGEMGAWRVLAEAVERANYTLGEDVFFGVDGAADRFYQGNGIYELDGQNFDLTALTAYYERMVTEFPILYTEDLFASSPDAYAHWSQFTEMFGHRLFVVLDDIATTNARLVRPLIEQGCGNMLLLKLNQVGTMTEGWRAAETAHHAGLFTVSSHRSTSSVDFMEIEVALALSMMRENMGRVIFAKCGGAKLIERAMRYAVAQQWVEDWEAGAALSEPMPPDTTIKLFKAYPAPLNTGDLTLGVRVILSDGREIGAIVPAGTSTGETEAALVPVDKAVRHVNDIAAVLGLEGMRLGDFPDLISFDQQLLALELEEAIRTGRIDREADGLQQQVAMEMKRTLGANALLGLSVAANRIIAAREGKPSWLTYREAGLEMNKRGTTLSDKAFYEPISARVIKGVPARVGAHIVRNYSSILEGLDAKHANELRIIEQVFRVQGSLVFEAEIRQEEGRERVYLRVVPGSKRGLARGYLSNAERKDGDYARGSSHKAATLLRGETGGLSIFVDDIASRHGEGFEGLFFVAIPHRTADATGQITMLIGEFDESIDSGAKVSGHRDKYETMLRYVSDAGYDIETVGPTVEKAFNNIPWSQIFTRSKRALFEEYIEPSLSGSQEV